MDVYFNYCYFNQEILLRVEQHDLLLDVCLLHLSNSHDIFVSRLLFVHIITATCLTLHQILYFMLHFLMVKITNCFQRQRMEIGLIRHQKEIISNDCFDPQLLFMNNSQFVYSSSILNFFQFSKCFLRLFIPSFLTHIYNFTILIMNPKFMLLLQTNLDFRDYLNFQGLSFQSPKRFVFYHLSYQFLPMVSFYSIHTFKSHSATLNPTQHF